MKNLRTIQEKNTRSAFTLIELALAALVVGIGLMALITLGRNAMQTALQVEDERRAAALAEDLFATLRSASSFVLQMGGYGDCTNFWQAVADGEPEKITELFDKYAEKSGFAEADRRILKIAGYDFLDNAAQPGEGEDQTDYTFPFHDSGDADAFRFQPEAIDDNNWSSGPIWSARYQINVKLTNYWNAAAAPNIATVGVNIRPRSSYLVRDDSGTGRKQMTHYTEYITYFTYIPLEPLRAALLPFGSEDEGGRE